LAAIDAKLEVVSPLADEQLKQQQEAQAQAAQATNGQQQAEDPNFQAIPEPQTVTKPATTEPAIETTPETVSVPAQENAQ